jgi:hypothetical protein
MNKNTRRARKGNPRQGIAPLSNSPEITIGCGEKREIGKRNAVPLAKGVCVDTRNHGRVKRYPEISFEDRRKQGW